MRILAVVTAPASARKILEHPGFPSEAPQFHAARPPPQMELEEAQTEPDDFYPDPPSPEW